MKKLILFELRKVFSKRLALIALIGIILFSALLSFSTFQNKYAFDQNIGEGTGKTAVKIDKEIAAKYEGILTDEKVQQMMSDFAPTHDLHGLNAMYLYQNATQSAAFSRFSDKEGNWNGLSVSDVFGNEEIKIGYVDGWLSTSKNMVRFFIALALAVIIMLAPIFSGEYEGVDNIILTSKYGKTKCATAKVAAGILTAILTTALVAAFNLLLALIFYGTEGLDCSILFAPSDYVEGFIPFNITCGTLLKYQILLAFTCTLSVTGITLFLSIAAAKSDSSSGFTKYRNAMPYPCTAYSCRFVTKITNGCFSICVKVCAIWNPFEGISMSSSRRSKDFFFSCKSLKSTAPSV